MKLEAMLLWKRGSFEQYEELIKKQERLHKKLYKLSEDISFEEDAMNILNNGDEKDYERYINHQLKYNDLCILQSKVLEQIKENNIRLQNEFY